jgi:hypothetical protein
MSTMKREIGFIDCDIDDFDTLRAGIRLGAPSRH